MPRCPVDASLSTPGGRRRGGLAAAAVVCGARRGGGRVDGDQAGLGAGGAQLGELVVGRLADQGGQFRAVRDVHRLAADVGLGGRGAPPVEVGAARAPAAAVELAQGGLQDLGAVRALDPVLFPADRQLPADIRLVNQRVYAVAQGLGVQGAPAATGEVAVVEEDARAVLGADRGAAGRVRAVDRVHLRVVLEALAVV